eukprot:TRINITY_DN11101_c0_g1_i2.p1 TRINITY_DN11101_c0_g1~~TRINITY_DN11101_c0_g1_i2.p1  ORF type:complete len:625 (+),score=105.17 TRINITY_DN11101_c0_g1_i2:52-1926(+)
MEGVMVEGADTSSPSDGGGIFRNDVSRRSGAEESSSQCPLTPDSPNFRFSSWEASRMSVHLAYLDGFSKCMERLVSTMEEQLCLDIEEALPSTIHEATLVLKDATQKLHQEICAAHYREDKRFGSRPSECALDRDSIKLAVPVGTPFSTEDSQDAVQRSEQRVTNVSTFATEGRPLSTGRTISLDHLDGVPLELPFGIINPASSAKLFWDFFVMTCVLLDAVILPFQLSFKNKGQADTLDFVWFVMTTTIFSMDIIVSFNTAVDRKDNMTGPETLVKDRKTIAKQYLRGWFAIDFVSTIPWGSLEGLLAGENSESSQATKLLKVVKFLRIMRLMRMLRLAKLKTIWENIETYLGSVVLVQSVMLVRILFVVIALCHWSACIFWVVGCPESFVTDLLSSETQDYFRAMPHWTTIDRTVGPNQPTWRYLDQTVAANYVFCFYWTLGVMRTMPAEVTPVNLVERVFVLCFMFFALSAFAISVGSLTQAYFKISERGRNYNDEMFAVRMHLKKLQVSDTAQRRIRNYLWHLFERRRIMAKEANLLDKLPEILKAEVKHAKIFQHLQRIPLITELGKTTIEEICTNSDLHDHLPGDLLCIASEVAKSAWVLCAVFSWNAYLMNISCGVA